MVNQHTNPLKSRYLSKRLLEHGSARSLILLTGARQTGKTTLLRHYFPKMKYINLDDSKTRDQLGRVPAHAWGQVVQEAILDEAQKLPSVFENIKFAFDEKQINFSILSGSSQVLLLKKIRETLAGRIFIHELYPLMLCEIFSEPHRSVNPPLLDQLLKNESIDNVLKNIPLTLIGEEREKHHAAQNYLFHWGGMPALLSLQNSTKREWLENYEYTYLERDLSDLAKLDDLKPFRRCQQLAALRASQLLNYSELARDGGISVDTTRRYLEYLNLSYQTVLLEPYYKNLTSRIIKAPKLYWLDMGILRQLAHTYEAETGALYENMIISEIMKWIKTARKEAELFFYRTYAGLELDLLIQVGGVTGNFIGVEIKFRKKIIRKDFKNLQKIAATLKNQWLGGLVIYNGDDIKKIAEPNIWLIPSWRLLI